MGAWPPQFWPEGEVVEFPSASTCECGEPKDPRAARCRLCRAASPSGAVSGVSVREQLERVRVLESAGATVAEMAEAMGIDMARVRWLRRRIAGHRQGAR
jgi:hypothetical protein